MSSLFPFLRSLLVSPLKPDLQRVVIQETIKDRDRGGFTTPNRQQDHLSFHDTGLRGTQGALIVLEALATNPYATKLTLSHNALGDSGVRQLTSRIRFLKNRRTVDIHDLNLASNSLTDSSLIDLCKSWPALTELYLSNNQISLASSPSSFQSHPTPILNLGHLTLLSLTSNPIDCRSISNLLLNPNFVPAELTTLHLSACSLDLSVAVSLALWLEDKSRSGKLEWLAVNGNDWGTPGCERITWALARRGGNSSLLRLEMLACDGPASSTAAQAAESSESVQGQQEETRETERMRGFRDLQDLHDCLWTIQVEGGWKSLLEKCETRNQALRLATRRAALGLVSRARHILLGSPGREIKDEQEAKGVFPWNRLPEELKLHIWRWVSILSAFPGIQDHHHLSVDDDRSMKLGRSSPHHPNYENDSSPSPAISTTGLNNRFRVADSSTPSLNQHAPGSLPKEPQERCSLPDPLTPTQLVKVIEYAQDRESLLAEIDQRNHLLFNHQLNQSLSDHPKRHRQFEDQELSQHQLIPVSLHRRLIDAHRIENELDRLGRSLILKSCGCLRFEGDI